MSNSEGSKGKKIKEDLEGVLDEIDDILEENAESFVRSYVQRGGQGWSAYVDPHFFIGAAMVCLLLGVSLQRFKGVIASVVRALRSSSRDPIQDDGQYDSAFAHEMEKAWGTAQDLLDPRQTIQNDIDHATALHWGALIHELSRSARAVALPKDLYRELKVAATHASESTSVTKLVNSILTSWLSAQSSSKPGS